MQENPVEGWLKDKTINVVRKELGYKPLPCDHHWVNQHKPGHFLYWVRICSLCHEPDWDDLDREIGLLFALKTGQDPDKFRERASMTLSNEQPGAYFQDKARQIVVDYFNSKSEITDTFKLNFTDTYVVWFCKTLQNWKALISTVIPDAMYYELTYDGDKKTTYIDAYRKFDNVAVPDKEVTHSIADP